MLNIFRPKILSPLELQADFRSEFRNYMQCGKNTVLALPEGRKTKKLDCMYHCLDTIAV